MVNSDNFLGMLKKVFKPFVWAFLIAIFLNPLMKYLEKKFKIKRWLSILIVYVIFFGMIILFFVFITPKIIDNIKNLVTEIPNYVKTTQDWFSSLPSTLVEIDKYGILEKVQQGIDKAMVKVMDSLSPLLNKTVVQVINFTSGFVNFILGSIISIYILKDKEQIGKGFEKIVYAIFSKSRAERIIEVQHCMKESFSRFLVGKIIDSIIIGLLCFAGCLIFRIHYALIIGLIVGVTNMIPYFGPFIGMIPAVIINLFYSPIKALTVFILIFALQQFDGLYLGPKILGVQVGLKPLWIISAIIIGGGFFGVWGMLFAVPVVAVIKTLLNKYIQNQYKVKGLDESGKEE